MSGSTLLIIAIIFVINLVLIAVAITDLMQRKKVKYISKAGWIVIIAVIIFGSVIYLLLGRGQE
ncbi:MAG: PLDc N-terminal domain-containing protein [Bacillota bacterium]|jgi:type VI protein secretion system component VasK|nr:PLDc N-terminal domain-containing protein [Bacillota bacterium]